MEGDIIALAKRYMELQGAIDELKDQQSGIREEFDRLRNGTLPDLMDSLGVRNINVTGVGRVALYPVLSVKTIPGRNPDLHDALRRRGDDNLIVPQVNSSTLRAYIKEQMEKEGMLPTDFEGVLEVNAFTQARITKN